MSKDQELTDVQIVKIVDKNNINVDKTDLIEWLSICDSIIDLLVRYKVSSIFPFNLCYQTLIALKDSIEGYKNEN